jgi:hypothetical protein
MDGKINDPRGNLFVPTKDQAKLYWAGWRLFERRKQGMIWIVRWADPIDGTVWPQGTAIQIMKERLKLIKKIPA